VVIVFAGEGVWFEACILVEAEGATLALAGLNDLAIESRDIHRAYGW
jgi:hypothetical protein